MEGQAGNASPGGTHRFQGQPAQSGGNQSNLNGEILNNFELPLLPLDQQRAIAARISTALAEAETLSNIIDQRLADLERLPARLLAEAFHPSSEEAMA